jgi:two-component system response regulator AtoC
MRAEADAAVRGLRRAARAAPPLLQLAIARGTAGPQRSSPSPSAALRSPPALVPEIAGPSAALEELRRAIVRAGAAPFAVLIEGESGAGKELVARAIHRLSPRAHRRFCDLNCAALPDELVEAELFGHARGAFTGAAGERPGLFEEASGGTLFLDEVSELSLRAQAKLLRVIQQQEVRRLGEAHSRPVDVRIVAAANRCMPDEAAAGRFRADLLYRLDVVRVRVPPLREHPEDVPVLAEAFWAAAASRVGSAATLSDSVLRALASYAWPGNVRELQNVMAALAVAAPPRGRVPPSQLPARIRGAHGHHPTLAALRTACERDAVRNALARAGGFRAVAARELGLTRQGLLKTMRRLDLR